MRRWGRGNERCAQPAGGRRDPGSLGAASSAQLERHDQGGDSCATPRGPTAAHLFDCPQKARVIGERQESAGQDDVNLTVSGCGAREPLVSTRGAHPSVAAMASARAHTGYGTTRRQHLTRSVTSQAGGLVPGPEAGWHRRKRAEQQPTEDIRSRPRFASPGMDIGSSNSGSVAATAGFCLASRPSAASATGAANPSAGPVKLAEAADAPAADALGARPCGPRSPRNDGSRIMSRLCGRTASCARQASPRCSR